VGDIGAPQTLCWTSFAERLGVQKSISRRGISEERVFKYEFLHQATDKRTEASLDSRWEGFTSDVYLAVHVALLVIFLIIREIGHRIVLRGDDKGGSKFLEVLAVRKFICLKMASYQL